MQVFTEQLTEALSIAGFIEPQTLNNSNDVTVGVNMKNFQRAIGLINVGANSGSLTARLESSATLGGSYTVITGTTITAITTANKQASVEIRADQMPEDQPFVRLKIIEGNTANCVCSGLLLGGVSSYSPASQFDPTSVVQRLVYNSDDA